MSGLPSNWALTTFGALNRFQTETVDPRTTPDETFELYSVPAFPTGEPERVVGSIIGSTKQTVRHGDVLVCKINPRINRVWQVGLHVGLRQIASSEWIGFRAPSVDPRYACYFFRSAGFREAICRDLTGVGGSLTRAQPKRVAELEIPLGPLPEQKRIANKLDKVLARVDACRERLESVTSIITQFRQSVLSAATSGRLTEDWRLRNQASESSGAPDHWRAKFRALEERLSVELKGKRREEVLELFSLIQESAELPSGWVVCPVGVVGVVSNGSTPSRGDPSLWGVGIPWVSSGEVRNSLIYDTREQITEAGLSSCSVKLLPVNTVLIAMIGEGKTRGQSAVLKIPATINQNVAAVVAFNDLIHAEYLWYSFQAKYDANRREGNGTGQQALNCQRVRELYVNLPPLAEQTQIICRVKQLFALADRLETRLIGARAASEHLTPAFLAKAFRGELVPQDPNDEPATELLKRLVGSWGSRPLKVRQPFANVSRK